MTLTNIVVPTDFSQNANLAIETAVDLAKIINGFGAIQEGRP